MNLQSNWLRNEFARAQSRRASIPPAARTTVVRPTAPLSPRPAEPTATQEAGTSPVT